MNFEELFATLKNVEGIAELEKWIKSKTDYFKAPASTRFHGNFEGGLVEHSIKVTLKLGELSACNSLLWSRPESVVIIGLFHDLCKTNFYKVEMRNAKNKETGVWEQVPYYTVDEQLPLGHGEKSIILLQRFINLTQEEVLCIRWHMGAYDDNKDLNGLRKSAEICQNVLWVQMADMLASLSEETR